VRLAVTGANGFVGRHLLAEAARRGVEAVGVVRSPPAQAVVTRAGGRPALVPSLEAPALAEAFAGADAVVHLAQIGAERGEARYESVNVAGTRAVAEAARRAGVPRAAFLSGLGVAHYGMRRRCTNPYFLSKLAAELVLLRSGLGVAIFRPSYVVGPGSELIPVLLRDMEAGEPIERIGDGAYRMQPIAVDDAAALLLASVAPERPLHAAYDLVGPEPVSYQQFLERLARLAQSRGRRAALRVREVSEAEADRRAAQGGFAGMLPDELDCLLCDEIGDPAPLAGLLGRPLASLDTALERSLAAADEGREGSR
jgi:nucleoside-diphosphate-sugar epimerase